MTAPPWLKWILIGACVGAAALPSPGSAQTPDTTNEVLVGTRVVSPFVIEEPDGTYSGLTVELWDHLAAELGIAYRLEERELPELIAGVENGSLFAAAAALTITSEREARVDFTHPFLVTGLGIAIPYRPVGLSGALLAIFSRDLLWVLFLLAGILFVFGLGVWIFERKRNAEQFGGSAAEGIGHGFWWAAVTMTTVGYGDKAPVTGAGRAVAFVWMFAAIILISFFTASISSSLTVTRMDSRVSGPQDLPFVRVGSLEGSATLDILDQEGIRATSFPTLEEGLAALAAASLDAYVHDAPILRYQVRENFGREVRVLPGSFAEQYYGIAVALGSEVRNDLNRVLLDYLASEEWEELQQRYLGEG